MKKQFSISANYLHGKKAQLVLKRDNRICVVCKSRDDILIHHIRPIRFGGTNALENQVIMCRGCHTKIHLKKDDKELTPMGKYQREWRRKNPEYMLNYHREWRKKHKGYYNKKDTKFYKQYAYV